MNNLATPFTTKRTKVLATLGAVCFWLAVWQLVAMYVNNPLLISSPGETLVSLGLSLCTAEFWTILGSSGLMFMGACATSAVVGTLLGALAYKWAVAQYLFAPVVALLKSAPVACVVVILFILLGTQGAIVVLVAMVSLPPFYVAVQEAFAARPRDAEFVMRRAGASRVVVFLALTWPAAQSYFRAAAKTAVALSWRAGVMGELLGVLAGSIGEAVYVSKITLDTPMLLTWTMVVMAAGWMSEKLAVLLLDATLQSPKLAVALVRRVRRKSGEEEGGEEVASRVGVAVREAGVAAHGEGGEESAAVRVSTATAQSCEVADAQLLISLENISKSYGEAVVLEKVSLKVCAGERVCLMAPTGAGKTTLLRILLGRDVPNSGCVRGAGASPSVALMQGAPVLQHATLVESLNPLENILLYAAPRVSEGAITSALRALLPEGCDTKPVCELSGGTRRLVEILRALSAAGEVVVMDEPFAGLDTATHAKAAAFISEHLGERALIVATHDATDASALSARIVHL